MNLIVLGTGTTILIILSWVISVKHGRYYGITRFFSFESIFILFLLNFRIWFSNPFSLQQIISWILLFLSLCMAIEGFRLLKTAGKPGRNFEETTILIKRGVYRYIRHPLYLSLFLLGTGIMFKNPGIKQIIPGTVNLLAVWITARIEEKEMIVKFGQEYCDYMKETRMFIPFLL
ncbi:MAG: methyltransferase family protein [Bacteroidales bacterium]